MRPDPALTGPDPTGWSALARRTAVVGGVLAVVVSITLVVWNAVRALLLIFVAFLIALLLSGLAGAVHRRSGLPYGLSLLLSGLLVVAALVGAGWFIGVGIADQLAGVTAAIPEGVARVEATVASWAERLGLDEVPSLQEAAPAAEEVTGRVMGLVGLLFGALSSVLVTVLLGVFFAASPDTYRRGIVHLVPRARRGRAVEVTETLVTAVRHWLVARLIIMCTTFALTWGGLSLIGVPFAGGLAVLSALVVFVPYVGPFISGSIAVLVALIEGPQLALYTALFFLALENIQGLTLEPVIEARMTAAPPGLLLSSQIVLGFLLGPVGFVLASPLVITLAVLVQTLYVQDALDDEVSALGEDDEGDTDGGPTGDEGRG